MKAIVIVIMTLFVIGCDIDNRNETESEAAKVKPVKYKKAINVKEWCAGVPPRVDLGYHVRLSQIVDDYAIFRGKGNTVAIPTSQLHSELKPNERIESLVRFIGTKETVFFENVRGFKVELELYDVISLSQFKTAEIKFGKTHGIDLERCQPFETSLL